MHVITRQRLQEFWQNHPDAERPLKAWLALVQLKLRHVLTHEEYTRRTQEGGL